MKIIHIGDCHVGKRPYGLRQREADIQTAIEYVVSQAITLDADVFIWPGDIWQSVKPNAESVKFMMNMVDRLKRNKIDSVGIDGNHDKVGGKWVEIVGMHSLDGNPFTKKNITIAGFHNCPTERLLDMIDGQEILPKCDVLVLHQAIAEVGAFEGGIKLHDLSALAEIVGARYVALGDIHQFYEHTDKAGRVYCYPGSVEVLTNDEPREKFFVEIDITAKKMTRTSHAIQTRPYIDMVVNSEESLAPLAEAFRENPRAFFAVSVKDTVQDGVKRCKALIRETEVLGQVWLDKADEKEKVVWERQEAIVDVETAINDAYPEGSDENSLIKACLANPDTLKEIIEEFVHKRKKI